MMNNPMRILSARQAPVNPITNNFKTPRNDTIVTGTNHTSSSATPGEAISILNRRRTRSLHGNNLIIVSQGPPGGDGRMWVEGERVMTTEGYEGGQSAEFLVEISPSKQI